MDKSAQVTIRLPIDMLAWLHARAHTEHRTLAAMIKALLEDTRQRETHLIDTLNHTPSPTTNTHPDDPINPRTAWQIRQSKAG